LRCVTRKVGHIYHVQMPFKIHFPTVRLNLEIIPNSNREKTKHEIRHEDNIDAAPIRKDERYERLLNDFE